MLLDYFAGLIPGIPIIFNQIFHWSLPFLMIGLAWCNTTTKIQYGKAFRNKTGVMRYYLIFGTLGLIVEFILITYFRYEATILIYLILWVYLGLFIWFLILGLRKKNLPKEP
jgi:hypothetical protein